MTKFKLGVAAGMAALLAFGVAACGQTTTVTEPPAAEAPAEPAATEAAPPADAVAPATDAAAPADPAAAPAPAPTTP